jgi:hypothetical protein
MLRLINKKYKMNFSRNSRVTIKFNSQICSGRITKSSWDGYVYIILDNNKKIKIHPSKILPFKSSVIPTIKQLNLEVFNAVQTDQGYAHISDGLDACKTRKQFFNIIRISHKHSKIALRKIEIFLKKYNQWQH